MASSRICSKCLRPNQADGRFCSYCGEPLEAQRSPELKIITVLFADIVNSTSAIGDLSPESAFAYLGPAVAKMGRVVSQFGGSVMRTMGDGLMALFGDPQAQENHALLACQAALSMRDSLASSGVTIRIGVHTGVVLSGVVDEVTNEQTAYGAAIHLASRLEHMASPGSICLTGDTFGLVRTFCDAKLIGGLPVKGFVGPVSIFELVGLKLAPTSEQFRGQQRLTDYTGRKKELGSLKKAHQRASRGEGATIGIVGMPGLGKSRLCFEFLDSLRQQAVPVVEARASPYGYSGPLQPLLEFLRAYFRIAPTDSDEVAKSKVTAKVSAFDPALTEDIPILMGILGRKAPTPSADPKANQARLLKAVMRLVRQVGQAPSVFVIEDAHWLDDDSHEFVAALIATVPATRILLLVTYRPTLQASWRRSADLEEVFLQEIGEHEMSALVGGLIGDDKSVQSTIKRIVERSGGNPFFAEELVRSLVDRAILQGNPQHYFVTSEPLVGVLPPTVQAVIETRIDRLPPSEKSVLQMGATIGREFPLAVLHRVAALPEEELSDLLDRLCQVDFFRRDYTAAGGEVVSFRHPLIQEVSYSMLIAARRAVLHAAVAKAIEAHHHDRVDEYADSISRHFEAAGLIVEATQYASRAALWIGTHANQAATAWKRVHALLANQPRSPATDPLRIMAAGQVINTGWRDGMNKEEAEPFAREALQLAREGKNLEAEILIVAALGRIIAATGSADEYVGHVENAFGMSKGNPSQEALLQAVLCHALCLAGKLNPASRAAQAALSSISSVTRFHRQMLGFDVERWVRCMDVRIRIRSGDFDTAKANLDSLISEHTDNRDPTLQFIPHLAFVELAWLLDQPEVAALHANKIADIMTTTENPYVSVYAKACRGIAKSLAGRQDEAMASLEDALSTARATRTGLEFEPDILATIAEVHCRNAQFELAEIAGLASLSNARRRKARVPQCRSLITLSWVLSKSRLDRRRQQATRLKRTADRLIEETGAFAYRIGATGTGDGVTYWTSDA